MLKSIAETLVTVGILVLLMVGCTTFMESDTKVKVKTQDALVYLSEPESFSSIVALKFNGRSFCSETVISDTEVLTAAHCVAGVNPFTGKVEVAPEFDAASLRKKDGSGAVVPVTVYAVNLRQDTAIIIGDFSKFKHTKFDQNPASDILTKNYELATCGFPNGGELICYSLSGPYKLVDMVGFTSGQMYAGMSGGPVIDLNTGNVVAVNHAVGEKVVVVAPIINLFNGLMKVQ